MRQNVAGVVLAGGQSRRMGQVKSLLTIPSKTITLLEHSQQRLSKLARVNKQWVFTSGDQHQQGISDIYSDCGPLSGIHSAISHILSHYPECEFGIFLPVDMPFIELQVLDKLVTQGIDRQQAVCFENHYLPLVLPISRALLKLLDSQLEKGQSAIQDKQKFRGFSMRSLLAELGGRQLPLVTEHGFTNINTQQQWISHCNDFLQD